MDKVGTVPQRKMLRHCKISSNISEQRAIAATAAAITASTHAVLQLSLELSQPACSAVAELQGLGRPSSRAPAALVGLHLRQPQP